jgi:hypothetical protein
MSLVGIPCVYHHDASTVAIVLWAAKVVRAAPKGAWIEVFKCLASWLKLVY